MDSTALVRKDGVRKGGRPKGSKNKTSLDLTQQRIGDGPHNGETKHLKIMTDDMKNKVDHITREILLRLS